MILRINGILTSVLSLVNKSFTISTCPYSTAKKNAVLQNYIDK